MDESWEDVTWSGSGEAHSRIVAGTAYDPGTASRGVNGEFSPRIHGRNSWIPEDAASGEPGRKVGLQDMNFPRGDTDPPFTTPSSTEFSDERVRGTACHPPVSMTQHVKGGHTRAATWHVHGHPCRPARGHQPSQQSGHVAGVVVGK